MMVRTRMRHTMQHLYADAAALCAHLERQSGRSRYLVASRIPAWMPGGYLLQHCYGPIRRVLMVHRPVKGWTPRADWRQNLALLQGVYPRTAQPIRFTFGGRCVRHVSGLKIVPICERDRPTHVITRSTGMVVRIAG